MPPRSLLVGGLALAVLLALGGAMTPVPAVSVTTGTDGPDICRPVAEGETFRLVFRHSMYGGEVREEFQIEGGRLVRTGMTTERAAAAEYYAYNGRIDPVPGGYRVVTTPEAMGELAIRLDRVGRHRLRFADREIALTEPGTQPVRAILRSESVPLITRLTGFGC